MIINYLGYYARWVHIGGLKFLTIEVMPYVLYTVEEVFLIYKRHIYEGFRVIY